MATHPKPAPASSVGGENLPPEGREGTHDPAPHDSHAEEPLGPLTPDHETPLGDTPEAHDELIPQDLPKDHPGRHAAEHLAEEEGGSTRGNQ